MCVCVCVCVCDCVCVCVCVTVCASVCVCVCVCVHMSLGIPPSSIHPAMDLRINAHIYCESMLCDSNKHFKSMHANQYKIKCILHAHTLVLGFHVLWGHSIGVIVLYCVYSFTLPTLHLNLPLTGNFLHFLITFFFFFCLIYKLVSSWGPKNVPTRTRISEIAIFVVAFFPHNVGCTRTTHTYTQRMNKKIIWYYALEQMCST